MKIAVFGAGAIGGHLAARLAHAGLDVSVVARGPHLDAIRRQGLRFVGTEREFTVQVRASDQPAELGPQDLVISAVKAHALPAAAGAIGALLGPQTPIVYAVNGVPWWYFHGQPGPRGGQTLPRLDPGGRLWQGLGVGRAIGCVVYSANEVIAPGVVRNGSPENRFLLGEPDTHAAPRLAPLAAVLQAAVPDIQVTNSLREAVWRKLLLNLAASPIACLTQSSGNTVAADPGLADVFRRTMADGARVAAALGIAIEPDADGALARMARIAHRSSMLQDLEAGRPMEIDAQLVAVQDLARALGVATPTLDTVVPLVVQRARAAGLYPAPG